MRSSWLVGLLLLPVGSFAAETAPPYSKSFLIGQNHNTIYGQGQGYLDGNKMQGFFDNLINSVVLGANASNLVVFPTGSGTPKALADIAAAALSQPHYSGGGFAPGHLIVGCPVDPFGLCDSGFTPAVDFNKPRDPGPADDYFQGYINGSQGYNSLTTQQFKCTVCDLAHPGAAVWVPIGASLAANTPSIWSTPSLNSGGTIYTIPGGNGLTTNSSAVAPINMSIFNLSFHLPVAPGAAASGKKVTFALWVWSVGATPAAYSPAVGCVVLETATSCSSTTAATVTKGQLFTVQAVSDSGATTSGVLGAGLVMQTQPGP